MVWWETYKETKNFSYWRFLARHVEIYVRCSKEESKTKMGHRESKARQWTKRWHNESRLWKVGSSNDCNNALQHTNEEQWRDPPQYWETQDKIHFCCWCRQKHETKVGREWTQTSPRSYHLKRDEVTAVLFTSSFRCLKHWKCRLQRQLWRENRKIGESTGMAADENQRQQRGDRWSKE